VTAVSPNTGPAAGGTSVIITGTNLSSATAVKFGGNTAAITANSATSITATAPAGSGTVDVTVTTAGGTSTTSSADHFTYTATAPPASTGPPTDSLNLKTLQIAGTTTVATISGQTITGQVDAAIGDAFSGGGAPVTVGPNGLFINFAAEPQRDAAEQEAQNAVNDAVNTLGYAGGVYKAPPPVPSLWSAWADLRGTGFDQNSAFSSREEQINVTGGIGRKLTPDILVGAFTGYEDFSFTMPSIAGKLTGDGGTVGGYAAWHFIDHWRVDGMFGWSDIFYKGAAGTATGAFDGSRWLGSGAFTGTYRWDGFLLEPSARIYALWESENAYTDSLGTLQAARSFSASRVSAGDKLSYPWMASPTIGVAPYVGLYTDFRFSTDNALPVGVPYVGIQDGWSERVTAGVTLKHASGATVSVGGELGGLGAGYDIWSANARVDWRF
jgi:hypothetical protein